MRTASPWWASLVFGFGLLFVLLGERMFGSFSGVRMMLTGLGLVAAVGITVLRAWTTLQTSGARRGVERALLMCQQGALLALLLYYLTTSSGLGHFHFSDKGVVKFETALTIVWTIVMSASLIPMLMIELSLGLALRTGFDIKGVGGDEGVEYFRVRDVGWSGLTIAFAAAFLMVTCNVASERNIQRDVSYFKTSSPGDTTKAIVASATEPIKVLLFFPSPNEVKDQVRGYFDALARASGHLQIEEHDRLVDAETAGKYKVQKDGVIVLVRGTGDKEKSYTIELDTDLEKARKGTSKLRNFDREVNTQLIKLVREKRKAYVVVGHGEVNDPDSVPPELKGRVPTRGMTAFKKRLTDLYYEEKDIGLIDLAKDVPDDATVVIMLAPSVPLQPAEWAALSRYLDKGGRLLLAFDPKGEGDPTAGELGAKLGIKFVHPGDLTDDQTYLRQRGNLSDRRVVITTQFSAHASTTALSRASKGLVLLDSGALEDAPVTGGGAPPKKTYTIHSMETSFLDLNDNFTFDATTEKRQKWNVAAAIEGPKLKDAEGKDKDGWRALVFADADVFADALVENAMGRAAVVMISELGGGQIFDDSVRWLGGEEVFSGETISEDDKPIPHTKGQDAAWFTLTIVGAPLLVLMLGLVGTWARRRRAKSAEVKS